jgi:hypothetical protein
MRRGRKRIGNEVRVNRGLISQGIDAARDLPFRAFERPRQAFRDSSQKPNRRPQASALAS